MSYCSKCGSHVDTVGAVYCPICGMTLTAASRTLTLQPVYMPPSNLPYQGIYHVPHMIVPMRFKNTTLATLLSVIPGIGQIYAGRGLRGLGTMALLALIGFTGYFVFSTLGFLMVLPFMIGIIAWQAYDAHNLAKRYNEYTRTYSRPPW